MDNYNYDENDDSIVKNSEAVRPDNSMYSQEPVQQPYPYGQPYPYYAVPKKRNPFATASLVFALLAIPGCFTIWFGIIFEVAAIVCAIVSRINTGSFDGRAVAGLSVGIIMLIFTLILFFMVLTLLKDPELMQQFNDIMEQYQQQYQQLQ